MSLTPENYSQGFLVDDELMAGVSLQPAQPAGKQAGYLAFVLRHTTGEYLGYQFFEELELALEAINRIPRPWTYESASGCGGGSCKGGACSRGGCGKAKSKAEPKATCAPGACESSEPLSAEAPRSSSSG